MLRKVSRSFAVVIQQLDTDLRNVICIFYLVLRALDTVEDDTSIAAEVKVPILLASHHRIYDRTWHFACGAEDFKVLMDVFQHVSTAFMELGNTYQEAIEDITMRMGARMAKFICKEVHPTSDLMRKDAELYSHPRAEERTVVELVEDDVLHSGSWIEAWHEA